MIRSSSASGSRAVTPLAGVWIEILHDQHGTGQYFVTPLAGVWIEIAEAAQYAIDNVVTPLAGVWIEMLRKQQPTHSPQSLPSRECGLKSKRNH